MNLDMWQLYPARFIALLEHLLTDGMDDEQRAEWEADMAAADPTVAVTDPVLQDLIDMRQAVDARDAAELIRLGEQMGRADGNPDKLARIRQRMLEINRRALEAPADT